MGTVPYMPPEMLVHQRMSKYTDVYSFGIISAPAPPGRTSIPLGKPVDRPAPPPRIVQGAVRGLSRGCYVLN